MQDGAQHGSEDVLSTATGRKTKAYIILVREIFRKYPYGRSKNRL